MTPAILLAIILLGLVGSAFFSGAEIAIISCNRLRMHHLSKGGRRSAATVLRLLESPRRVVTMTLLGTNFFNVAAASAATGLFTTLIPGRGAVIATVLITPLILVFGEVFPKTLFRQYADGVCLRIAPGLDLAYRLLIPLVWVADGLMGLFLDRGGKKGRSPFVTREELQLMLSEGERMGLLPAEGRQMIHQTFTLSETRVKTVMVPLVDVFALDENLSADAVLGPITEQGHSRVPVYRGRVDNIVGILYVFDLLEEGVGQTVGDLMHPAYYVPETKGLEQLLLEMKQSRMHQAVVVDEFGGASGIVTLEDALEKIVGEIRDEFDRESDIPEGSGEHEDWTTIPARAPIGHLRRRFGIQLPEGDYETIGGYLTDALGRIPEPGELHTLDQWEIEVLESTPQSVRRLRLRKRPSSDAEAGG